jgi:hypothetical protein
MVSNNSNRFDDAAARPVTVDNQATQESLIGTERRGRPANVSWGSIFAGVVTFLAVTVLLSLVTAGIGLGGSGIGAGIWSVIALAIALAAGGFVAGALAVRSGLLHGFLTWATSLVVALAFTVWLGASLLGAVGGVVNSASQALSGTDVSEVVEDVQGNVDEEETQEQADEAVEDAQQTAEDAADAAQASSWWGFVGLLLGAVIASLGGMFGVRTVINRDRESEAVTVRTTR